MVSIYGRILKIEKLTKYLLWIFLGLLFLNLVSVYTVYCCDLILKRIDFNHEVNPPTLYAAILLLFSSSLLKRISKMDTDYTRKLSVYWKSLSYIFLFLACDEAFKIHDSLNYGEYGDWLKFYVPLVLLIGVVYLRFLFKLPRRFGVLIFLSGAVFVTGAVGFEIIGIYFKKAGYTTMDFEYRLLATGEESLEFLGLIAFISTLLKFIHSELPELIVLKFPLDSYLKKKFALK